MGEKTINQWMKEYGIDTSWYDIKSDNSTPITATKSTLVDICGHYTTQQANQIIGVKEKTEQEKAYENYLSRKNKYSKYDLKISKDAVILYNKNKKVKHVSVAKDEEFDREKGLMMCLLKDMGITYSDIQVMLKKYDKEQAKLMREKIAKEEEKAKRRAEQEANIAKKAALNQ
jgi:hypothetical protein|nr:MAG TPA: hypothetical protein [Caudoviricetes sp.]